MNDPTSDIWRRCSVQPCQSRVTDRYSVAALPLTLPLVPVQGPDDQGAAILPRWHLTRGPRTPTQPSGSREEVLPAPVTIRYRLAFEIPNKSARATAGQDSPIVQFATSVLLNDSQLEQPTLLDTSGMLGRTLSGTVLGQIGVEIHQHLEGATRCWRRAARYGSWSTTIVIAISETESSTAHRSPAE